METNGIIKQQNGLKFTDGIQGPKLWYYFRNRHTNIPNIKQKLVLHAALSFNGLDCIDNTEFNALLISTLWPYTNND